MINDYEIEEGECFEEDDLNVPELEDSSVQEALVTSPYCYSPSSTSLSRSSSRTPSPIPTGDMDEDNEVHIPDSSELHNHNSLGLNNIFSSRLLMKFPHNNKPHEDDKFRKSTMSKFCNLLTRIKRVITMFQTQKSLFIEQFRLNAFLLWISDIVESSIATHHRYTPPKQSQLEKNMTIKATTIQQKVGHCLSLTDQLIIALLGDFDITNRTSSSQSLNVDRVCSIFHSFRFPKIRGLTTQYIHIKTNDSIKFSLSLLTIRQARRILIIYIRLIMQTMESDGTQYIPQHIFVFILHILVLKDSHIYNREIWSYGIAAMIEFSERTTYLNWFSSDHGKDYQRNAFLPMLQKKLRIPPCAMEILNLLLHRIHDRPFALFLLRVSDNVDAEMDKWHVYDENGLISILLQYMATIDPTTLNSVMIESWFILLKEYFTESICTGLFDSNDQFGTPHQQSKPLMVMLKTWLTIPSCVSNGIHIHIFNLLQTITTHVYMSNNVLLVEGFMEWMLKREWFGLLQLIESNNEALQTTTLSFLVNLIYFPSNCWDTALGMLTNTNITWAFRPEMRNGVTLQVITALLKESKMLFPLIIRLLNHKNMSERQLAIAILQGITAPSKEHTNESFSFEFNLELCHLWLAKLPSNKSFHQLMQLIGRHKTPIVERIIIARCIINIVSIRHIQESSSEAGPNDLLDENPDSSPALATFSCPRGLLPMIIKCLRDIWQYIYVKVYLPIAPRDLAKLQASLNPGESIPSQPLLSEEKGQFTIILLELLQALMVNDDIKVYMATYNITDDTKEPSLLSLLAIMLMSFSRYLRTSIDGPPALLVGLPAEKERWMPVMFKLINVVKTLLIPANATYFVSMQIKKIYKLTEPDKREGTLNFTTLVQALIDYIFPILINEKGLVPQIVAILVTLSEDPDNAKAMINISQWPCRHFVPHPLLNCITHVFKAKVGMFCVAHDSLMAPRVHDEIEPNPTLLPKCFCRCAVSPTTPKWYPDVKLSMVKLLTNLAKIPTNHDALLSEQYDMFQYAVQQLRSELRTIEHISGIMNSHPSVQLANAWLGFLLEMAKANTNDSLFFYQNRIWLVIFEAITVLRFDAESLVYPWEILHELCHYKVEKYIILFGDKSSNESTESQVNCFVNEMGKALMLPNPPVTLMTSLMGIMWHISISDALVNIVQCPVTECTIHENPHPTLIEILMSAAIRIFNIPSEPGISIMSQCKSFIIGTFMHMTKHPAICTCLMNYSHSFLELLHSMYMDTSYSFEVIGILKQLIQHSSQWIVLLTTQPMANNSTLLVSIVERMFSTARVHYLELMVLWECSIWQTDSSTNTPTNLPMDSVMKSSGMNLAATLSSRFPFWKIETMQPKVYNTLLVRRLLRWDWTRMILTSS